MVDLRMPPRLRYFYPAFKRERFALLDIGCVNHLASITKQCRYSGIDREMYNIGETHLRSADRFFLFDLDRRASLEEIPDGHFGAILASMHRAPVPRTESLVDAGLPKTKTGRSNISRISFHPFAGSSKHARHAELLRR
jgi:hypothetical protein